MKFTKPIAEGRENWSEKEDAIIKELIKKEMKPMEIKKHLPKRSITSIKNKVRRMRFKVDKYGLDHRKEKYDLTRSWIKSISPIRIFEGFAGEGKSTIIYLESSSVREIHSCEINKYIFAKLKRNIEKRFNIQLRKIEDKDITIFVGSYIGKKIFLINEDSQKWAARLYSHNKKFDFLDLDTCGTVLPSLASYLKLIDEGHFLLTLGEFQSYRFGRKDALIKSNPLIFKEIMSNTFTKRMTVEDFYNSLIAWIYLIGSQTISYKELREITLKQKIILGQKPHGICRVLFDVKRADSLAKILNNTSIYLKN